jgi:hypothetical protein
MEFIEPQMVLVDRSDLMVAVSALPVNFFTAGVAYRLTAALYQSNNNTLTLPKESR